MAIISSFSDNKLTLSILNGSQFHINSLENDVAFINELFSKILKQKISIYFEIKLDNSSKSNKKENKPEQHPLLDKAIDLLDGEEI